MKINFNPAFSKKSCDYTFKGSTKPASIDVSNFINTERMVDSFINLAKIDSGSNEELAEKKTPSSDGQKKVASVLKKELEKIGLTDIKMDEYSIVTATLESNIGESPVVGLLAHMDTSPDAPSKSIQLQINDYKGGDIALKESTVVPAKKLEPYIGQKIITSDGTTLLGADDKAGIAEILESLRVFKEHPELKHPKIRIAFTPDEEVGMGTEHFDIKKFGADVAYTVDGDLPHIIEDESFNAFNPEIIIKGKSTHCGAAKEDGMINSIKVANWIINKLPKNQAAETTEKKQGYYHVDAISGNVSETKMNMLVRDHNYERAKLRVAFLQDIVKQAEKKFHCEISFDPKERYHNMKQEIKEFPEVVNFAKEGLKRSGLTPQIKAIRGGTDGSELSLKGLLTPNLGAGGQNFHSKSEFLPVEDMKKCTSNILNTLIVWAEKSKKVMPKILARRM